MLVRPDDRFKCSKPILYYTRRKKTTRTPFTYYISIAKITISYDSTCGSKSWYINNVSIYGVNRDILRNEKYIIVARTS